MSIARKHFSLYALTLFLCGVGKPASAQAPAAASEEIILGAWSDPKTCNRTSAKPVSFNDIIMQREAKETCVAVEGYWAGRAIFESKRDANTKQSNVTPTLIDKRIGLYARDEVLAKAPSKPIRYLMIGTLGQCETQWPGAMMVMGYCHFTHGPLILISQVVRIAEK